MTTIGAMFLKEIRSYFDSILTYIFIVIFLVLSGSYVAGNLFLENTASMGTFFEIAPVLLLLFAPAVTMRLIAEEKRVGTYEIITTKPVHVFQIVIGKFLAAWFVVACALLPTLLYLFVIASLGPLDFGPALGGCIGLLLLGGVFVAAGLFGSSLSDNQMIALIIGFLVCFLLYSFDKILLYVPVGLVNIIEYLGIGKHFGGLTHGVLDARLPIYYFSLMVLFLVLATVNASREPGQMAWRWGDFKPGERLARVGLAIAILLFINLFAFRTSFRMDLTGNKVYTLSDVTKRMLGSLDDHFLVRAYFSPELPPPYHNHRENVQQLLEEYRAYSRGMLHYQFVNPQFSPGDEEAALSEGMTPVQVKIIRDNKLQSGIVYAGMTFTYGDKQERLPVVSSLERLEYEISGSLKKMTAPEVKSIAVLTNVGGPAVSDMRGFVAALSRQYSVKPVDLSVKSPISQTVDVLLVIAPTKRLSEPEKFIIDQFLMRGGRAAFFLNAVTANKNTFQLQVNDTNMDDMFDAYGWIVNKDAVADSRCASYIVRSEAAGVPYSTEILYPFYPVASEFNRDDAIVKDLSPIALSYVSSVDPRLAGIRGAAATVIVTSSPQSRRFAWDSVDVNPLRVIPASAYTDGQIPIAVKLEGSFRSPFADPRDPTVRDAIAAVGSGKVLSRSPRTRVVVVGDGDFVLDGAQHGHDNIAFAVNTIDWLLGDTFLASIRSRDVQERPLTEVSQMRKTMAKYITFAGPPAAVLLMGVVWMVMKSMRRKKHKFSY